MYLLKLLVGLGEAPAKFVELLEHAARLLLAEETGVGLTVFLAETLALHVGLESKLVAIRAHAAQGVTVLFYRRTELGRDLAEELERGRVLSGRLAELGGVLVACDGGCEVLKLLVKVASGVVCL